MLKLSTPPAWTLCTASSPCECVLLHSSSPACEPAEIPQNASSASTSSVLPWRAARAKASTISAPSTADVPKSATKDRAPSRASEGRASRNAKPTSSTLFRRSSSSSLRPCSSPDALFLSVESDDCRVHSRRCKGPEGCEGSRPGRCGHRVRCSPLDHRVPVTSYACCDGYSVQCMWPPDCKGDGVGCARRGGHGGACHRCGGGGGGGSALDASFVSFGASFVQPDVPDGLAFSDLPVP